MTKGDKHVDMTLDKLGGKGLFVKELERALLSGEIDMAVHSMKDVPDTLPDGLEIAAYSRRADARDALVLRPGVIQPVRVGTSSLRRKTQVEALLPGARVQPVRGNILTRLARLDAGEFDALVLAAAGLERMELMGRASRCFTVDEMLPAAGQGVLGVEIRSGDARTAQLVACVDDADSRRCVCAERAYLAAVGGGCHAPCGAYGSIAAGTLTLRGMLSRDGRLAKATVVGDAAQYTQLGKQLAQAILQQLG